MSKELPELHSNSSFPETWWNDSHLEKETKLCPTCRGSGLNRWEDDDCERCNGEGYYFI
jgi:hypothetical protein